MSYRATIRALEAARRRQEREERARQREIERHTKTQLREIQRSLKENFRKAERALREQAKLDALEQARQEVREYEQDLADLVSVHKTQNEPCNWLEIACSLPPPEPKRIPYQELLARQQVAVLPVQQQKESELKIRQARERDDEELMRASKTRLDQLVEWSKARDLALRVLSREIDSYTDAIRDQAPFAELNDLGSSIKVTAHSRDLVECSLKVHGTDVVPSEAKSLTAGGKVTARAMPRTRFHEIYQDHICSCMLRVTREVFALLPVNALIVTSIADIEEAETGRTSEESVLTAAISRNQLATLDFESLDPSDTIERLLHRGDFKATRKSAAFQPIAPLTPNDVGEALGVAAPASVFELVGQLRVSLKAQLESFESDYGTD